MHNNMNLFDRDQPESKRFPLFPTGLDFLAWKCRYIFKLAIGCWLSAYETPERTWRLWRYVCISSANYPNFGVMVAFILRLLLFSGSLSSIWAACGHRKSCCPGKNISCASFDWLPGQRGVLEWRRCFCDEFCVKGGDCCSDFKKICVQESE